MSSNQPFFDEFGNEDDEFNYMLQEYDEQFNDSLIRPASQNPQRKGAPAQVAQRRSNCNGNNRSSGGGCSCEQATPRHSSKNLRVEDVMSGPADKKFARVFEFEEFNLLQSRCFDVLYNSNVNIVVSGKQQTHLSIFLLFFSAHRKRKDDCF